MLDDRYYMRQPSFRPRWWSMTVLLVFANIVAFVLQMVLQNAVPASSGYLALSVEGLMRGYVWQLLSFQFMHSGLWHLLLNCLAIFMFGRDVEQAVGRKSFLTLYFSSGVIGGLLQIAFDKVLAQVLQQPGLLLMHVVGASAGAFGLIAAFAMLYPERPLTLLVYFVIPVNMRAKFLLIFEGLATLIGLAFSTRSSGGPHIADAAHLGGMITGIVFVRYAIHWEWPHFHRMKRRAVRPLVKVPYQKSALWGRTKHAASEDLPPEEFLSKEVDPILDKISAQGIQSLTERERRILEAAREKMGKR